MTSKIPFLTIITATYNAGELIAKTANSLRDQSFKNFEWIIIDGASTDSTLEIVRKYKDLNIYCLSEVDQGIFDAWNKGLKVARGEWISFLGAGDVYLPDGLSSYVDKIKSKSDQIDFISSKIQLIDEGGRFKGVIGERFNFQQHIKYMKIGHVGAFHNSIIFKKYGIFSEEYSSSGDYEFFIRCGANIRGDFLNRITVRMPIGGVSSRYKSLYEAYAIQKKYQNNSIKPILRFFLANMKYFYKYSIKKF